MAFERMGRKEFAVELGRVWEPGDHLSAIGPTKRGKSYLMGQVIPQLRNFDTVAILTPKGPDKAYAGMGHPAGSWPPRRSLLEVAMITLGIEADRHTDTDTGPRVWRVHCAIRGPQDWPKLAALYARVLQAVPARKENHPERLLLVCDETRYMCDPKLLGRAGDMAGALILGRSKTVSIANAFQAPRWVPREALDQITHGLSWRNRDRDVAKRLAEISGVIDVREFMERLGGLAFHECIWVNGATDAVYVIAES